MFTENVKPRKRGRPSGQTPQGAAARERLYAIAMRSIADRGYEATTLRDIARTADVSVGLLYRYFPSKQAIVIALYDELSTDYARQAADMPPGKWRDRFLFAVNTSLDVLEPHRVALRALTPVLVGDPDEGIFARRRRSPVCACSGSSRTRSPDRPMPRNRRWRNPWAGFSTWSISRAPVVAARQEPKRRATTALIALTQQLMPSASLALRMPPVRRFVIAADELIREALFQNPVAS